jgi:hypothetical protein
MLWAVSNSCPWFASVKAKKPIKSDANMELNPEAHQKLQNAWYVAAGSFCVHIAVTRTCSKLKLIGAAVRVRCLTKNSSFHWPTFARRQRCSVTHCYSGQLFLTNPWDVWIKCNFISAVWRRYSFHLQQNLFQSASSCGVVLVTVSAVWRTDILFTFQQWFGNRFTKDRLV